MTYYLSILRAQLITASTLLLFTGNLVICGQGNADSSLVLSNYYPSLFGSYDQLRLVPHNPSTDLSGPCNIGTLYVNSSNILQYCSNVSGAGVWGPVSEVWTQVSNDIYLADTQTNPLLLKVGIGTTAPPFKLTLEGDAGIIAKGNFGSGAILPNLSAGSRLIWYPRKAAFRAGYVDGSQWDDANIGNYSTAFGKNTVASSDYSVVAGGDNNIAIGLNSAIAGGQNNTASGNYSAIASGIHNAASGLYSSITGGRDNVASSDYSTVIGGNNNQIISMNPGNQSFSPDYASIGGGANNTVKTPYSVIGGGFANLIDFDGPGAAIGYAVIGGGANNQARNDYTVIVGGQFNTALARYASITGGSNNTAGAIYPDGVTGIYSRVSCGQGNTASADYSTVFGGQGNIPSGIASTVGAGLQNTASGNYSVVAGGERNTANGQYSMVMGGTDNIAGGEYSWAEGRNVHISAAGTHTFAWGYSDDNNNPINITVPDAFIIAPGRISGSAWNPRVGIRDTAPAAVLEINADATADDYLSIKDASSNQVLVIKNNGYIAVGGVTTIQYPLQFNNASNAYLSVGGQWVPGSSRKYKERIRPLSSKDAKETLDKLNPVTFKYKSTNTQTNVGFIAEDVPDLVALKGRKALSAMDIVAVLTKVAQDQEEQIKIQAGEIEAIKNEIKEFKKRSGI